MPSRNYAIITESHKHTAQANGINGVNGELAPFQTPKNPRAPLHAGEQGAGTTHPAAEGMGLTGLAGTDGLDVAIRVEKNPSDREGHTAGYGFSIPALEVGGYKGQGERW